SEFLFLVFAFFFVFWFAVFVKMKNQQNSYFQLPTGLLPGQGYTLKVDTVGWSGRTAPAGSRGGFSGGRGGGGGAAPAGGRGIVHIQKMRQIPNALPLPLQQLLFLLLLSLLRTLFPHLRDGNQGSSCLQYQPRQLTNLLQ
ncbi:hypothetical protein Fcan01_01701, partial [Folsomia candida]